jgi:hypothetical protein
MHTVTSSPPHYVVSSWQGLPTSSLQYSGQHPLPGSQVHVSSGYVHPPGLSSLRSGLGLLSPPPALGAFS